MKSIPSLSLLVSVLALTGTLLWDASSLAAARQTTLGQISGTVAAQTGGALPNTLAQLRDLDTNEVIGTVATTADGQFVFVVTKPGNYVVEIVNAQGAVVATTAAIALTPARMVVSSVSVTAPPSAANSAASAPAAGSNANANADANAEPNPNSSSGGDSGAGGALAGGTGPGVFAPTAPYVSNAAGGAGSPIIPGTVPSTPTASPSR